MSYYIAFCDRKGRKGCLPGTFDDLRDVRLVIRDLASRQLDQGALSARHTLDKSVVQWSDWPLDTYELWGVEV